MMVLEAEEGDMACVCVLVCVQHGTAHQTLSPASPVPAERSVAVIPFNPFDSHIPRQSLCSCCGSQLRSNISVN